MQKKLACSIILPAYNEEEHIKASLNALTNQTLPRDSYEIIVVDNGSEDATREIAASLADKVIDAPDIKVGQVRNTGAKQAAANLLIFVDSDCSVNEKHLETALQLAESQGKNTVLGGSISSSEKPPFVEKYWLLKGKRNDYQQRDLMGCSIVIDKDVFFSVNGFPPHLSSGEDSALSQKLKEKGYNVKIKNEIGVIHLGNPKTITEFIARQAWHAQSYIDNWPAPLRDKVFWLVIIYPALTIFALDMAATGNEYWILALIATQMPPAILSLKRIIRARFIPKPIDVLPILFVDNLYLIGRAYGFLKGLFTALSPR